MARTTPDSFGNPPFASWAADHRDVSVAPFADAADGADVVINATSGTASLAALGAVGSDHLAGTLIVDVANAVDVGQGTPALAAAGDDSLAEQIQRRFPDARVVKTLNTMNAAVMADPGVVAGGDHTVFVSGNDTAAKEVVTDLLRSFGWTDIIDLGDITTARGVEQLLPLWITLFGVLRTPRIQLKVVR
jgi:predicted dinucleotide-binding enzyme